MTTSKASDASDYVDLQIRTDTGDTFKVQGSGQAANRPYGVSDKVTVNPGFGIGEYVKGLNATATSLAGGEIKYVSVQAAIRANMIHFQITGPHPFAADNPNEMTRDYGASFNVMIESAPALAEFVHMNGTDMTSSGDFLGTDDDPSSNDGGHDTWGPSTYKPNVETGECECPDCGEFTAPSDGSPKTVVIDGVTYNITPVE